VHNLSRTNLLREVNKKINVEEKPKTYEKEQRVN
jgi:hypothetical protein